MTNIDLEKHIDRLEVQALDLFNLVNECISYNRFNRYRKANLRFAYRSLEEIYHELYFKHLDQCKNEIYDNYLYDVPIRENDYDLRFKKIKETLNKINSHVN